MYQAQFSKNQECNDRKKKMTTIYQEAYTLFVEERQENS